MTAKYASFALHKYCRLSPGTNMLMKKEYCVYCMSVNHQELQIHEYECCVPCSKKCNIGGLWCLIRLVGNGAKKCYYGMPHTSVEGT
jgi:hypothetical protein